MADDTNNGRQESAMVGAADAAATPASTSSLYVVDDQQRRRFSSSSSSSSSPSRPLSFYRDLYTKDRLDFRALARGDPDFAAVCTRPGQIDFRDPAAVRQLSQSLLRRDFGLTVALPPDRLCPPVPNRLSYVVWVTELVNATTGLGGDPTVQAVAGLDIGTGASCIYPLLASTVNPSWRFVATDIDAESLASARANVERNGLTERIKVVTHTPDDPLVAVDESDSHVLAFTMCNPPFYASADEMAASAAAKQQPPHSACTGAPVEMVYPLASGDVADTDTDTHAGGEVAFVGRILAESLTLRGRVVWYTAMLGKLASLAALVPQLRAHGIDNYAVRALVHGSKTRRWVLGWSFGAVRPTVAVARGGGGPDTAGVESYRHLLPAITEVEVLATPRAPRAPRAEDGVSRLGSAVDTILRGLELASWEWDGKTLQGVGRTRENVWGRAWRRKKQREEKGEAVSRKDTKEAGRAEKTDTDTVNDEIVFGFVVSVRVGVAETAVHCRWLEGHNEAIYQSFCGFLKTRVKENMASKASWREECR